ncbi:DUF4268 domain-containing protein [Halomicronema sp. CCY15110]|uniref:DUF4268 domain-containing protein n=1 Tax=Halomicronema sp. CCY15110 TaxID=2767773 RepID=UPI001EF2F56A|nr:DUF4268 domain-containing protein [Halomicronema sp. CCY15110]
MLAEDVETTLRDFIEAFYKTPDGDLDEEQLNQAIEAILTSGRDTEKKFLKALRQYLGKSGLNPQDFDEQVAKQAFAKHLDQPIKVKGFGDLTLYEYIQLFRNVWAHYQTSFKDIDWKAIDQLLDAVRSIRNAIAHFREITPQQREQLKFCADFLDRHRPSVEVLEPETAKVAVTLPSPNFSAAINQISQLPGQVSSFIPGSWQLPQFMNGDSPCDIAEIRPPDEEVDPLESRYAPLAAWLQSQEQNKVTLAFQAVETIIQDTLPSSARKHRNWWANDTVSHSQSKQWLEVGWRVANINLSEEQVVFSRLSERKIAYADFFNTLQPKLEAVPDVAIQFVTVPQGGSWVQLTISAQDLPPMTCHINFLRRARLCISHYIGTGNRDTNRRIFEHLQVQSVQIEADFGTDLCWERLIGQQGARISIYREQSSITDPPEVLEEMQTWILETLPRFYKALAKPTQNAYQVAETKA